MTTYAQRYSADDSNTAGAFRFDTHSNEDWTVAKLAFGDADNVTRVDASHPLPVTISGVATSANQTTIIGHLDGVETLLGTIDTDTGGIATSAASIDGKITACNTGAVVVASGSITANAGTNLNTSLLALESGGNLAAAATALAIIDDWDESDRAKVNVIVGQAGIAAGAGAVGATVPRVTLASDDPAVALLTTMDADTGTIATHAATLAGAVSGTEVQVDVLTMPTVTISDGGGAITVDGSVSITGSVAVTGTFWQATQPVSVASVPSHDVTNAGTFAVQVSSALPAGTNAIGKLAANSGVDIGDVDVTSVPADPFGANADAASATGSISAKLRFIASTGIPITGTVTVGSHEVTNAGTFAVQAAQSGTWTVQPGNTANTTAWLVTGTGGTFPVTDSGGSLTVDNAGTFAVQVDGTALTRLTDIETNTDSGAVVGNGAAATSQRVTIANDSTGVLAGVTTVTTVTTCSTVTTLTGGGIAHDSADSGNPHKIGAKAETSPKGITLVADGDRTDLYADADGVLMVKLNTSGADVVSEAVSNTDGASTAFSNFSAVASTKNYITAYHIFRTDAGTTPIYVDFRDGTGGSVLWRVVIPPNGGANSPACSGPALFKTSANTALAYDVSAATTTVYIQVSGYQSKV